MLVAIVFHAYFDVDVEELLRERRPYVCDKVSIFVINLLQKIGLKTWSIRLQNNDESSQRIAYQDVYKILKQYIKICITIIHN